jgi:hypothetical protein
MDRSGRRLRPPGFFFVLSSANPKPPIQGADGETPLLEQREPRQLGRAAVEGYGLLAALCQPAVFDIDSAL